MIIKLNEFSNKEQISFDYVEKSMDSINTLEGISIKGNAYKDGDIYIIEGTYETTLRVECVRCLAEIEPLIQGEFKGKYMDSKCYSKYLSSLKLDEELDNNNFEEAVNGEINISNLVREYIILDLSQYEACFPECSIDSEIEKYSGEDIDPRWQQLLDIKL